MTVSCCTRHGRTLLKDRGRKVLQTSSQVAKDQKYKANSDNPSKLSKFTLEELLELIEAAEPAMVVLVARFGVWELAVRENDLGSVAQVEKIQADECFLVRRIGGPTPGEGKFFRRLNLLVSAAKLVDIAVLMVHLQ